MTEAPKVTRHLRITGRVQGVGYRMSMVAVAQQLGVRGWVRNRHDGSVEAMLQASGPVVDDLIAWAHQGPPSARVDAVEITEGAGDFVSFAARPDA